MLSTRLAIAAFGFALMLVGSLRAAERPHVVVYLSDDHSQFDASVYGNERVPTPETERLAADGMTFTHAFVASPSCAPSRAALLTGLMPARNGCEANHTWPSKGTHYLVSDLQRAGYEVAAIGKVAHGRRASECGFDYVAPAQTIGRLLDKTSAFLRDRDPSRPLCLFVGTTNPHVPWPDRSDFDASEVELPPHHIDTHETRRHRAAYYQEISDLDTSLGELRRLAAHELGPNTVTLHSSDHGSQWPFGKWNLYDYGTRVPLIVSWPDKVEPGSTSDALVSWVDVLPTLLDLADGDSPKGIDGRSFAPVLFGDVPSHRQRIYTTHTADGAKNRYPIRSVRTKEWKLIHNLEPTGRHTNHSDLDRKPMAGAYWHEWEHAARQDARARKIVDRYHNRPEWELYRVANDRWELHNLAERPEHTDRMASMRGDLHRWMDSQDDRAAARDAQ